MTTALVINKHDLIRSLADTGSTFDDLISTLEPVWVSHHEDPFRNIEMSVLSRDICEYDDTLLQIIPYVVLKDRATGKIFTYKRGPKLGENRLIDKCSIGLGGHMEPSDITNSFTSIVVTETLRELQEEVDLEPTKELHDQLTNTIEQTNYVLLYSELTSVSRVHIGLGIVLEIDSSAIGAHEDGVITVSKWLSIDELSTMSTQTDVNLEEWSEMMLTYLLKTL